MKPGYINRRCLPAVWLVLLLPASVLARPPQGKSAECLVCHGQPELKSESGRSVYVDPAKHKASVHAILECTGCHEGVKDYPHPKPMPRVDCASCHSEPAKDLPDSIHSILGPKACSSCHGNQHQVQPAAGVAPHTCANCHADAVRDYGESVHATALKAGETDAATCNSCHGPAHRIRSSGDPASKVAKKNLPDTCGACHANPEFLARHNIPFALPIEAYRLSVHGRAVAAGNENAASCSDCHGNHAIFPARDPRSRINHWNVPKTCGACHTKVKEIYEQSVHGQAVARSAPQAPVCVDCHGEHNILAPSNPQSLVNPERLSTATCARCHSDERLIARYALPTNRVPTFQDSYHGLALRAGSQTVANCASCHGIHNIFPSTDPRSTVHPANLAHTCGACHAGAGTRFAIGPVHVRPSSADVHPVVKWIRWIYLVLIPLTVAFMVMHNLLDFLSKLLRRRPRAPYTGEEVERMGLHFRVAHWMVAASFPLLVWTGFALTYPDAWWAQIIIRWEGGFAARGRLHRIAAVMLMAACVYHIVHLLLRKRDRIMLRFLIPVWEDARQLFAVFRYNLGLSDQPPQFGKFNYAEKIEYLAFIWGTLVMAVSGLLLWFNNFTLRHFPKWVADAATAIHFYEAILAALSILIWHFYITIFDPDVYPMDRSWLTGKASADHLRHTRAAYFRQLKKAQSGVATPPADTPKAGADSSNPPENTPSPKPID
jgi:formate dehydrogenase gamma subunit